MSLILPEKILKYTKCSICNGYLSCGPVEVFRGKRVVCGRCTNGDIGAPSLFNKLAEWFLFPCVNRYEGCNKLLQHHDIKIHEIDCIGNDYPCPICPLEKYPIGSLLSLLNHYSKEHVEYVLEQPEIIVNLSDLKSNCHYLYCDNINNYLFVIYVDRNGENIKCNASVAGNKAKHVMQMVNNSRKRFCSDFNNHSEVFQINIEDLSPCKDTVVLKFIFQILHIPALLLPSWKPSNIRESNNNWPEIFFSEEFLKKYSLPGDELQTYEYKLSSNAALLENIKNGSIINIKCDFCCNNYWDCKWNIQRYIFRCNACQYVGICQTCITYGYQICHMHNTRFEPVKKKKIYHIFLFCRNNCGVFLKFWQLREHENICFGISEEKYVKRHFGISSSKCEPNTYFIRGNIFKCPVVDRLKDGRIYMVTHDGFKCIINFCVFDSYLQFHASHDYDKSKLYISFNIYENGRIREEVNNFPIQYVQQGNKYVTDCFFAANFKNVNLKAKMVIKD